MKKRILTLLLSLVTLIAFGHDYEKVNAYGDTIYYCLSYDGTTLGVCNKDGSPPDSYSGNITIPDSVDIDGKLYGVAFIESFAFQNCTKLTGLTVPSTVVSINLAAFQNCVNLKTITLPENVKFIGLFAFDGCTSLKSLEIPKSVTTIGSYAFSGCTALTDLTIHEGVKKIYGSAFSGCKSLKELIIPNGVNELGGYVFSGCTNLSNLVIPESVEEIGDRAFNDTPWYKQYPNGLMYVGKVVYEYRGTMPQNTSIELKEGIVSIRENAFNGCAGLTSLTIPESVTSIGNSAFDGCSGFKSLTIPKGVTSISISAFRGCTALSELVLSEGIKNIDWNAFQGCNSLTTVTLPRSLETISISAFHNCTSLKKLICYAYTPPTLTAEYANYDDRFFGGVDKSSCTFTVPAGAVETYKHADYWKEFSLIEAMQMKKGDVNGDDNVTMADANMIVNSFLSGEDMEGADVNGDGSITMADANQVVNMFLSDGYENYLPDNVTLVCEANGYAEVDTMIINDVTYAFSDYERVLGPNFKAIRIDKVLRDFMTDNTLAENQVFYLEGGKTYFTTSNTDLYKGFTLKTTPEDLSAGKPKAKIYDLRNLSDPFASPAFFMLGRMALYGEAAHIPIEIDQIIFEDIDFDFPGAHNSFEGGATGNYLFNQYSGGMGIRVDNFIIRGCSFQRFVRGFCRTQCHYGDYIDNFLVENCEFYNCGGYSGNGNGYGFFTADLNNPKSNCFNNMVWRNNTFFETPIGNFLTHGTGTGQWADPSIVFNITIENNTFINFNNYPSNSIMLSFRSIPMGSTFTIRKNLFVLTKSEGDERPLNLLGADIRTLDGVCQNVATFDIHDNWSTNDNTSSSTGEVFSASAFSANKNSFGAFTSNADVTFPAGVDELKIHIADISAVDLMYQPNPPVPQVGTETAHVHHTQSIDGSTVYTGVNSQIPGNANLYFKNFDNEIVAKGIGASKWRK